MNPRVVILGGGPSSVFAYYGALQAGYKDSEVEIWASKQTYPSGAFWLHEVPVNRFAPAHIDIILNGSPNIYCQKQWGMIYETSWLSYPGYRSQVLGYNPHAVLPHLWRDVNKTICSDIWSTGKILELAAEIEVVVQTFPTQIDIIKYSQGFRLPVYTATAETGANYCIYNGSEMFPWVRKTQAFGYVSYEYPYTWVERIDEIMQVHEPENLVDPKISFVPDLVPTTKPIADTVYGPKRNILLVGRWATLNRKALSHHAQKQVREFLATR